MIKGRKIFLKINGELMELTKDQFAEKMDKRLESEQFKDILRGCQAFIKFPLGGMHPCRVQRVENHIVVMHKNTSIVLEVLHTNKKND